MAEERKLQVRKVDVFPLRMNVAADVGVSYVNTWLAFNLLPTDILLGVPKQKLCPAQENHISNTSCDFAYEPDISTKYLILLFFFPIVKKLPLAGYACKINAGIIKITRITFTQISLVISIVFSSFLVSYSL